MNVGDFEGVSVGLNVGLKTGFRVGVIDGFEVKSISSPEMSNTFKKIMTKTPIVAIKIKAATMIDMYFILVFFFEGDELEIDVDIEGVNIWSKRLFSFAAKLVLLSEFMVLFGFFCYAF